MRRMCVGICVSTVPRVYEWLIWWSKILELIYLVISSVFQYSCLGRFTSVVLTTTYNCGPLVRPPHEETWTYILKARLEYEANTMDNYALLQFFMPSCRNTAMQAL